MRARTKKTLPIGEITSRVLKKIEKKINRPEIKVFAFWPDIVGREIAGHTLPLSCKTKRLVIGVDSSAWISQLSFLKADIIKKVNKTTGLEIKELIFKVK
ncbi:MAG: DUF721 domain-containing protein [Candidatus Omnitrophica bacterium]|nr:DUF721 domain-containing protein [Candidatus Omnitrophota bacterium]